MTDDVGRVQTQGRDELGDVVGEALHGVTGDRAGLVGEVVAAQIGRVHVEPGRGQARELVAPRVPELGEAVQQQHRRPRTRPRRRDVDAVQLHLAQSHEAVLGVGIVERERARHRARW
ncbi:MAG: hypothetical protein U0168_14685 [Nannocystaceae bacterium]